MPDYPGTVRDRYTRITLFRAPEPVQQATLKDAYIKLVQDAKKDGKRYILRANFGPAIDPDSRAQGFTFATSFGFESLGNVKYYDETDELHLALKQKIKDEGLVAGPPVTFTI